MTNGQIKGDGTSRLLKSYLPNTYDEFKALMESGQLPVDVLFNPSGWSTLPTFLNEENLIKSDTALLYGEDTNATPEKIFRWFTKFLQYYWRRRNTSSYYIPIDGSSASPILVKMADNANTPFIAYIDVSDSVSVDSNGNIRLVNPTTVAASWESPSSPSTDADVTGKYFRLNNVNGPYVTSSRNDNVYHASSTGISTVVFAGATLKTSTSGSINIVTYTTKYGTGPWEYVNSFDRNAYPDSGTVDNLEYEYIGVPFNRIREFIPQMTQQKYTGNGNNECQFTFEFIPKFIVVQCAQDNPSLSYDKGILILQNHASTSILSFSSSTLIVNSIWNGNTVNWSSSASAPMNTSGVQYVLTAFG